MRRATEPSQSDPAASEPDEELVLPYASEVKQIINSPTAEVITALLVLLASALFPFETLRGMDPRDVHALQ